MKKKIFGLILPLICLSSLSAENLETPINKEKNHRINFGVLNIGYEYSGKSLPYFNFDIEHFLADYNRDVYYIKNAKLEIGHSFQPCPNVTLTPFIGSGAYHLKGSVGDRIRVDTNQSINYFQLGGNLNYSFTDRFSLGFLAKLNRTFNAHSEFKFQGAPINQKLMINKRFIFWENKQHGLDLSIPICYIFGRDYQWDFQISPSIYLPDLGSNMYIIKNKLSAGYRF